MNRHGQLGSTLICLLFMNNPKWLQKTEANHYLTMISTQDLLLSIINQGVGFMDEIGLKKESTKTVGNDLRSKLFNKLSPVISSSDNISSSDVRLSVQANCLDLAVAVEEFIEEYGLDCLESRFTFN